MKPYSIECPACSSNGHQVTYPCKPCFERAPGSMAARNSGCLCPVMDNGHGRGRYDDEDGNPVYVQTEHCPLHGAKIV